MFRSSPVVLCALFAACATTDAPQVDDAGVRARVAVTLETDVSSVEVTATPIDCATGAPTGAPAQTGSAALLGQDLADYELDLDPTVATSEHDFTDVFLLLEAGCYDVTATPLQADGATPSVDCVETGVSGVEVFDGQTTEILLLSTCDGGASGGLDTIVAFNEEPTISDLTYDPSKFTDQCVATTVCVEATDPNADPIAFEWSVISGAADLVVTSFDQNGEIATECVEVTPTSGDDVEIEIVAMDLVGDGRTIEQYLADNGIVAQSRDDLTAPVHVSADPDATPDCQPVADPTCPCFDGTDVAHFYDYGATRVASGATYEWTDLGQPYNGGYREDVGGQFVFYSSTGASTFYASMTTLKLTDASGDVQYRCEAATGASETWSNWFPNFAPTGSTVNVEGHWITESECDECRMLVRGGHYAHL